MNPRQSSAHKQTKISKIVRTSLKTYVATSAEHDLGLGVLADYIPGPGTLDTVTRLDFGMRGGKHGRAISVTGPYGSGKSTMAVFLDGLYGSQDSKEWKASHHTLRLADHNLAKSVKRTRKLLGVHEKGLVRCTVTASREPVSATIVRALDEGAKRYFDQYAAHSFEGASELKALARGLRRGETPDAAVALRAAKGLCAKVPVLIIIDEFGKNVEYFTDENGEEGDLFLLQSMAELASGLKRVPLFLVTLQHMALEGYISNASAVQGREWAKVQGRFDDIPFSNSPEQTRLLVASVLRHTGGPSKKKAVESWAKKQAAMASDMGLGSDINYKLLFSCYPLHPLLLEVLPDMCARYGQNERTLLSFVAGGGSNTVARFIDDVSWDGHADLPAVGLDTLYDYFVAGSSATHAMSTNISRLMEISTIIRDAHNLSKEESRTLKTIGVLNLLGRSGKLRASRSLVRYATAASSDVAIRGLEKRSIITYRRHADEYRVWHGTDVDIRAVLEIARRRRAGSSLADMLNEAMRLDPVVAARHARKTGTLRVFERHFADPGDVTREPKDGYDGAIVYVTGRCGYLKLKPARPVVTVETDYLGALREAAIEVSAIRDVLGGNPEITEDWVARKELNERLAGAESDMIREFESAFDEDATWRHVGIRRNLAGGFAGEAASDACKAAYRCTPLIFNEMINRNALSSQGAAAMNRLLGYMVEHTAEPRLGISGWGPERAIYETLLTRTGIHRSKNMVLGLHDPNDLVTDLWNAMTDLVKGKKGRISVYELYAVATAPPFGARTGILPILVTAMMLSNKDRIAVYEHGTYCPVINAPLVERLAKNPIHFQLKYFAYGKASKNAIKIVADALGVKSRDEEEPALLDVVSELVQTVRFLVPHILNTTKLDADALAVRKAISDAREPDALLFESLPKALGIGSLTRSQSKDNADKFAKRLAKSINTLRNAFDCVLAELRTSLLETTGMRDRQNLSNTASAVVSSVEDQKMKIFLTSVSHDVLENDNDWIKYVALTLTGIPPAEWSDEQRGMFENNLRSIYGRFARLASMHFAKVSDSFAKPAYRVTITHADGKEDSQVVALTPGKKIQAEAEAERAIKSLRKKGFTDRDMRALLAALSRRISPDQ